MDYPELDVDSIALRLLCEKAQERLERAWTAAELAHQTVQLPDGSYAWAKRDDIEKSAIGLK
jgi:ribosomal protein S7